MNNTPKVIGETYQRNRFEVHARLLETGKVHDWRVHSRSGKTIDEARNQIAEHKEHCKRLQFFVDQGKWEYAIAEVTAIVKIVE